MKSILLKAGLMTSLIFLGLSYKEASAEMLWPSKCVKRVAPNQPTVNTVKYTSKKVTGKTEKYAKVTVKIGTKKYTAKANAYVVYKVYIPKQRAGTKIYVYAKDAKGKVSATRKVMVAK